MLLLKQTSNETNGVSSTAPVMTDEFKAIVHLPLFILRVS